MSKKYKPSRFVLAFVKLTGFIPALIFFKPKIYYENKASQNKRLSRPSILMSNHKSLLDFALYLIIFPFYSIRFLMAEVLYNKSKLFSWFLYRIGGIRVDRDIFDFSFVGDSLDALDNNEIVGIFPESRLPVNGVPFPFKPSVAFIGLRTDAPIIPVYTDGNYGIFKRAHIMIGEKIYLKDYCDKENPSKEEIKQLTQMLEKKVYDLKTELEKRTRS